MRISHMNEICYIIPLVLLFTVVNTQIQLAHGTNTGSFTNGYWASSGDGGPQTAPGNSNPEYSSDTCKLHGPDTSFWSKGPVVPAVTNTTACEDGFFAGYKNWCSKNSLDCVENITVGDIPPMLLKVHEEYLAGAKAGNGTASSCPFTGNAAFCQGWLSSNDYDDEGCSDSYPDSGPFSQNLIGCPLDSMNQSGMAKPSILVGTWNYLNKSSPNSEMPPLVLSGKISYSPLGNFTLTIPSKNIYGDNIIEGSWGRQNDTKHNILTLCYDEGCDNSTLTTVTSNHIKFTDLHNDLISLTRINEYPSSLVGARLKDDLLSRDNHNGTVLPAVDFPANYIDLSNPFDKRPSVTTINDIYYHQKWGESRDVNRTLTTWTIHNMTSGSNGLITFTDFNMTNLSQDFVSCPNYPPTYTRFLNHYIYKGTWALLYPIEKTPDQVLELCSWYGDSCTNLIVQKLSHSHGGYHIQLLDSHGDRLYLTQPSTPEGTNKTISLEQANRLLGEDREIGNATEVSNDAYKQDLRGNYVGAIALNLKAWRIDPYDTYIPNNIALDFYILGDYRDSVAWYNKVLAMESYNPSALRGRGMALDKMGDYIGALRSYNQLFGQYPRPPYPSIAYMGPILGENVRLSYLLNDIGIAFSHLHRYSDSITAFDAALSINSTDDHALYNKAITFAILGLQNHSPNDFREALQSVDAALAINPNYQRALTEKSFLEQQLQLTGQRR